MTKKLLCCFGAVFAAEVFIMLPLPRVLAAQNIFISQVQITGGSGHTADDFVELYNPNEANFNLKGYRLVKRTAQGTSDTLIKSWTADTLVPPKSFYLWANSGFTAISAAPDVTTSGTLANDNGVAVRLGSSDTGAIVDSAAWGSTANTFRNVSAINPTANQALARNDLSAADSGFNLAPSAPRNFKNALIAEPGLTPAPLDAGPKQGAAVQPDQSFFRKSDQVKISEILPDPLGEDAGHEAVELENGDSLPVNLAGWYLGDQASGAAPGPTAYALPETVIGPGAVAVIIIPKDYFVLNNSASETLNLFFSDATLADSATYTSPAKEGLTYQKVDGDWLWGPGSLGVVNAQALAAPAEGDVRLSEIMPNPQGADEGKEWVEIYNASSAPVDLKNYVLDGGVGKQAPGRAAYKIAAATILPARQYLVVTLPEDAFSLANAGDMVSFYSPQSKLLQQIWYQQAAPEGQTYAAGDDSEWRFGPATPGQANAAGGVTPGSLKINELLSNPAEDQDEFVEIVNSGDRVLELSGFALAAGTRRFTLPPNSLEPGQFFTIYEADLPAHLANAGGLIKLLDPAGLEIDAVSYPKSLRGQVWARGQDGNFAWTSMSTPGSANILQAQAGALEAGAGQAAPETPKAAAKSAAKAVAPTAAEKRLLSEIAELKTSLAEVSGQLSRLAQAPGLSGQVLGANLNSQAPEDSAGPAPVPSPRGFWFYVLVVGLSAACLALLVLVNRERVQP